MTKTIKKNTRRKLDVYSIIFAVLIASSICGYNYYRGTTIKTCFKAQSELLDKYRVDFQKLTVKDYRVDAQQKLIKQDDLVKKLKTASLDEQLETCKNLKGQNNDR